MGNECSSGLVMSSGVDDPAVMAVGNRVTHSLSMPDDAYLGTRTSPVKKVSDDLRESDSSLSSKSLEEHGVVDTSTNARDGLVRSCR